jgi:hypothetical protein
MPSAGRMGPWGVGDASGRWHLAGVACMMSQDCCGEGPGDLPKQRRTDARSSLGTGEDGDRLLVGEGWPRTGLGLELAMRPVEWEWTIDEEFAVPAPRASLAEVQLSVLLCASVYCGW